MATLFAVEKVAVCAPAALLFAAEKVAVCASAALFAGKSAGHTSAPLFAAAKGSASERSAQLRPTGFESLSALQAAQNMEKFAPALILLQFVSTTLLLQVFGNTK
ncbi:MAG: hypothetical protein LBG47_02730 [Prevotellaceae bacterium]|nr:hypothetical protein [Prevotellaceae bacterium]